MNAAVQHMQTRLQTHAPTQAFEALADITAGANLIALPLDFSPPAQRFLENRDLFELSGYWKSLDRATHNKSANITTSESFTFNTAATSARNMRDSLRKYFWTARDEEGSEAFIREFTDINEQIHGTLNPRDGMPGRFQIRLPVDPPTASFNDWLRYHCDGPTLLMNLSGPSAAYLDKAPPDPVNTTTRDLPADWQSDRPHVTMHSDKQWHGSPPPPPKGRLIYQTAMTLRENPGFLNRLHRWAVR